MTLVRYRRKEGHLKLFEGGLQYGDAGVSKGHPRGEIFIKE